MQHEWIRERLAQLPGRTQSDLARHMGLYPERVSEIIAGTRKVKLTEVEALAAYLELDLREAITALTRRPKAPSYGESSARQDPSVSTPPPTNELPATLPPALRHQMAWLWSALGEGPAALPGALDVAIELLRQIKDARTIRS